MSVVAAMSGAGAAVGLIGGGLLTSCQHHAHPGRPVLEQERERQVHLLRSDHVVVVQDQQGLAVAGLGGQLVDQRRDQALERRRRGRAEQRATRSPIPGRARSSAATAWRQNRAGSLSPASSDSHPAGRPPRRAQSASRTVLPYPAGAQTSTSPRARPPSNRAVSRGRGTRSGLWGPARSKRPRPGNSTG